MRCRRYPLRHDHLIAAVDDSLRRLGVDQLTLWQHHRPDPATGFDEIVQTLSEIYASGKVRMIGLSNVDPAQLRQAHGVLGDALASVQNQFSPKFRSSGYPAAHHQTDIVVHQWVIRDGD